MNKLTIPDLNNIREKTKEKMKLRKTGGFRGRIIVHMGTCGIAAGAREVLSAILQDIENKGLKDINVTSTGCAGLCNREPMITVEMYDQAPVKYIDLNAEKVKQILEGHIIQGNILKEYVLAIGSERVG